MNNPVLYKFADKGFDNCEMISNEDYTFDIDDDTYMKYSDHIKLVNDLKLKLNDIADGLYPSTNEDIRIIKNLRNIINDL